MKNTIVAPIKTESKASSATVKPMTAEEAEEKRMQEIDEIAQAINDDNLVRAAKYGDMRKGIFPHSALIKENLRRIGIMIFKEVMEKFKTEADPKIILDALEELSQACSEAAAEAQKASEAYYANAEAKKQKISDRVVGLRKQLEGCETKVEALRNPLVSATVSGDERKLEEIKARIKEQEVEKIQLATEIKMLESTHVSGDKALYEAVVGKSVVHENLRKDYVSAKVEAYRLAGERIKSYEKIQNRTQHFHAGGGNGAKMDEIERHFNHGKYAKFQKHVNDMTR